MNEVQQVVIFLLEACRQKDAVIADLRKQIEALKEPKPDGPAGS